MLNQLFSYFEVLDDGLWSYFGFPIIVFLGIYLSLMSNFVQIRKFPAVVKIFLSFLLNNTKSEDGVHPIKAFFACVGGCIGIGNIVAICTAVQIGGPGALFWIWMTALLGMILKYSEVYLGVLYRVPNDKGGYNGGPMYFLQRVFKTSFIPMLVCVLLCVYGVEVYQFSVVTSSISSNFHINKYIVTFSLLILVIFAGRGGVKRVGQISSAIIPLFVLIYLGMGFWVLLQNIDVLPPLIMNVFVSAFTGHAAIGGFIGSTLLMTISQGIRRGCYTSDVGVGYASVIHSESRVRRPEKQAALAVFDIFLDTFLICTTSVFIILISGAWKEPMHETMIIQTALSDYFPYMHVFMPVFIFLLGYSTIIAYFCVGLKCAEYLAPKYGRRLYYAYAVVSLFIFSFIDTHQALVIMSITQAMLLVINLYGVFRLRHEIVFTFDTPDTVDEVVGVRSPSPVDLLNPESV